MAKVAKVPVVMQMEALECGAASLCMVLAYYGKWLPLEQVRADCGVSRDGSSAKNVLVAARSYGLKAQGYRMEPDALRSIVFPAIIHWNFNHFVVLCGFKKDKAVLNDPARGTVEVTLEEFDRAFTGIVLCFEKTENFVPSGKPKSIWEFAKKRLRGTAGAFVFVMLTSLLTAGIMIIIPIFSRIFMDHILSGKNPEWLPLFIAAVGIALLFQFVVTAIQGIYWLKIEGKLAVEANASFMWHVLRLPVDFFAQRFIGDIASRQASNESIASTLIGRLAPIFLNIILLLLYFIIMLKYSVILSIVGIANALINLLSMRLVSQKRVDMSRVVMRDSGKLSGVTVSGFEMIETIKASGAENSFFERWTGYFAKQSNAQITFNRANQFYGVIPSLLQQGANICVLMIGVYLILDGVFTIGMLLAFQGFLSSFLSPVNELVGVSQSLIEMRSQMERIEDVFSYETDVAGQQETIRSDLPLRKLKGQIEINNVTFGYNRLAPPLITEFSLNLRAGGSVAFVGGSGSGKSTLAKLIAGLYRPWSGEILFDGFAREEIERSIFTGSLAVVDQEIILFEDTIFNNIAMWDKTIDEATVIKACKDAQIHEDIMLREGGYEHVIKEGGKNFSGGQRQR
ncbi:MAG TPA: NHLP family bacteriocin export ABC transporter peptidase/permease/ATPase, partial [Firmicutes bacterium]|nr:NHLP family bacteriocin export ABC transporter peptidase/permease/ATPase [Bacillota bacterium]